MTTTMENEINLQQDDPMAATAPNPPFSLPPYPKMILDAIEAANEPYGCNKTAIVKYIESTQITLPPSHNTLLNYHLNHMKQTGQLMMCKNNYMKPDPNAPPKRGRGRPPKPKPDSVDVASVSSPSLSPPRPRGRPPKSKEAASPSEPKSKAPSGSGRPRGRPPKKPKTEESETTVKAVAKPEGERRGRGRPPKVKPAMVPVGC